MEKKRRRRSGGDGGVVALRLLNLQKQQQKRFLFFFFFFFRLFLTSATHQQMMITDDGSADGAQQRETLPSWKYKITQQQQQKTTTTPWFRAWFDVVFERENVPFFFSFFLFLYFFGFRYSIKLCWMLPTVKYKPLEDNDDDEHYDYSKSRLIADSSQGNGSLSWVHQTLDWLLLWLFECVIHFPLQQQQQQQQQQEEISVGPGNRRAAVNTPL